MQKTFKLPSESLIEELSKVAPPLYSKPFEIGCFSYDEQRNLTLDRSQLVDKRLHIVPELTQIGDLGHNIDSFVQKTCRSHLHPILAVLNQQPEAPKVEIVTWRGVLSRIVATSFDFKTLWAMYGTVRNGIAYIEEERLTKPTSQREIEATYWGHKFEGLCMVDRTLKPESVQPLYFRRDKPIDTNAEFGIVLKVKLGSHRFVIGAEVDGTDETGEEYIELKTSKQFERPNDQQFFKEKMMKYWIQSFLAGVPKVLVGFRDRKGHIKSLEYYKVPQMPSFVRGFVKWDPNAILLYGDRVFTWLKEQLSADTLKHGDGFSFSLMHNADGVIEYSVTTELSADLPTWYKYY